MYVHMYFLMCYVVYLVEVHGRYVLIYLFSQVISQISENFATTSVLDQEYVETTGTYIGAM